MASIALYLEVLGDCFYSLYYWFDYFGWELKGEVSAVSPFGRP